MAYNPIPTFLQEAEELIADIEQSALVLCAEDAPAETVNRLFRAFHTIKGASAMCGLELVAAFTHHVESLLDKVRGGAIAVSAPLAELVLKARDHIKLLLDASQGGAPSPAGSGEMLVAAIEKFTEFAGSDEFAKPGAPSQESVPIPAQAAEKTACAERSWTIRFHPNRALLENGGNPVGLLRSIARLGTCQVTAHTDAVPTLDAIQPDGCYLWWTIALHTVADENAIRDEFMFVEDGSEIAIEAMDSPAREKPVDTPQPDVKGPAAEEPAVKEPPGKEPASVAPRPKTIAREATVKVPAERLDRLVNLVGEFVMNHSCLAQAAAQTGAPEFANPVQVLERLVAELRDNVLGIRMLPIDTLFGRFRRLVHDLSAELGKEVDLVTEGGETELDKSILDQLGEPLVHCLRNCLDHGVEPAAERATKGKPARATIRLSAAHMGSSVVIAVEDDGRGIDREAVRAKALEKQLLPPHASLSNGDILNLILLPGFSTARQVTSVSGRGVGMDVIKRQIDFLRGSLSLDSKEGQGTRVSITLPLTLAIIDGLLVGVGGDRFILPMTAVAENVELNWHERARHNGRNVLAVRGELVPYIDLRIAFEIGGDTPAIEKVVIVQHGNDRVGLVVDRVLGTHQTVIQSLGSFYKNADVVSGATIMGDGRVALIIDIAAVVRYVDRQCRTVVPAA
jgi:two-component system chemotaxis sensor kinase CheA